MCLALTAQLQARGWEVEHFALCEKKIGNCAGDFFCWIRTPGVCNVNDDNRQYRCGCCHQRLNGLSLTDHVWRVLLNVERHG